jgi:hypothetical protein
VLSLGVAIWIFWFLYKDISLAELADVIAETSILWLGASILIAVWGFWLRAWRWKLLIDAGETHQTSTWRAFWALQIGYLANLIVPRAGEVARCGVLKKTERIEMGKLFVNYLFEFHKANPRYHTFFKKVVSSNGMDRTWYSYCLVSFFRYHFEVSFTIIW